VGRRISQRKRSEGPKGEKKRRENEVYGKSFLNVTCHEVWSHVYTKQHRFQTKTVPSSFLLLLRHHLPPYPSVNRPLWSHKLILLRECSFWHKKTHLETTPNREARREAGSSGWLGWVGLAPILSVSAACSIKREASARPPPTPPLGFLV
jgi:hypothetical protein